MIEVTGLTKSYQGVLAVDNLSFTVAKGEIVGFLGPNGAGKSTTMRMLTGYMPATRGKAVVAGLDVFENPLEVKKHIGYLPESPPVYTELLVSQYLEHVGNLKGLYGPKLRHEIGRVAELAGIADKTGRLIRNLSKGYRQRVGLAQALLGDPDVLVLDEPTADLDPLQRKEVLELVTRLRERHTIILSTHILPDVESTCQRAIVIANGRIVAEDTIEHLIAGANQVKRVHIAVKGATADLPEKLARVTHVAKVFAEPTEADLRHARQATAFLRDSSEPVTEYIVEGDLTFSDRAELAKAVVEGGFGLVSLADVSMRLEDVFRGLVTTANAGPTATASTDAN
jgi:ABC-2 type transport system ATP-binding protein